MKILDRVALWDVRESLLEGGVAVVAATLATWLALSTLSSPLVSVSLPPAEVAVVLAALVAVVAAASARVAWLLSVRDARAVAVVGVTIAMSDVVALGVAQGFLFARRCAAVGGEVASDALVAGATLCRVGGVPGNPYLPGVVYRSAWNGWPAPTTGLALAVVAVLAALAMRDRAAVRSRVPKWTVERLLLEASAGLKSIPVGDRSSVRGVQACANPTFWGETCGQIYPADTVFAPGEWCARCLQTFQRCERVVDVRVVSLATADVEILNGLERIDTNAWRRGDPIPPEPQLSGRERWVTLGTIGLPEVLTVAQALAVVLELAPGWAASGSAATKAAAALADERASRVAAWFWFGPVARRLSFARPNRRAFLAVGATRLSDVLANGAGEEVTLQLDVGLLPVELRTGSLRVGDDRVPEGQNAIQVLWVPTGPPGPLPNRPGGWIPRVEGAALRTWLTTERLLPPGARSGSVPLPYWRHDPERVPDAPRPPRPGTLDLVHLPLEYDEGEPVGGPGPGSSIAEWDWFELEQLQWLRQRALVLVSTAGEEIGRPRETERIEDVAPPAQGVA